MFRKMVSILMVLCVMLLSSVSVNVFAKEISQDLFSYSKEWHLDVMTCVIEKGNGAPTYLAGHTPKSETPFISFATPYAISQIWTYGCKIPEEIEKRKCPVCGSEMGYADVLYEINEKCGHGIFCLVYYCQDDGICIPDQFYTQCGCE